MRVAARNSIFSADAMLNRKLARDRLLRAAATLLLVAAVAGAVVCLVVCL